MAIKIAISACTYILVFAEKADEGRQAGLGWLDGLPAATDGEQPVRLRDLPDDLRGQLRLSPDEINWSHADPLLLDDEHLRPLRLHPDVAMSFDFAELRFCARFGHFGRGRPVLDLDLLQIGRRPLAGHRRSRLRLVAVFWRHLRFFGPIRSDYSENLDESSRRFLSRRVRFAAPGRLLHRDVSDVLRLFEHGLLCG